MPVFRIPYGESHLDLRLEESRVAGVLESRVNRFVCRIPEADVVRKALDAPVASPRLEELAAGKRSAVVVTSDHTRPVPSRITLPPLLERLRAGNPSLDVRILVATGFHRATAPAELADRFGPELLRNEKILVHDSRDDASLVRLGTLPSGGELWLNRAALETDLLISEGFIEPHFFAGFSGGRKSILPGIAGYRTVLANHCAAFIASPNARTGRLGKNPIHEDMVYAAEKAGLAFILNVVLNPEKRILAAFAGHFEKAHETGCRWLGDLARVEAAPADIVVTSNGGHPLDQNVYQAVKGMTAAEATCRPGGVIVMAAACGDGHGGKSFYETLRAASGPREILDRTASVPMGGTAPDQWEFQILARILNRFRVILVSDRIDPVMVREMHMEPAASLDAAMQKAFALAGTGATVTVVPDGVSVIVESSAERRVE